MINWSRNEKYESVDTSLSSDINSRLHDISQSNNSPYEKKVLNYLEDQQGYAWCTDILEELEHPRKSRVALNNLYDGGLIDSKPKDNGLLIVSRELDGVEPGSPDIGLSPIYARWPGEVFNPEI